MNYYDDTKISYNEMFVMSVCVGLLLNGCECVCL